MKIAFLGDIALVGQYDKKTNPDVSSQIAYLKKLLAQYDFVAANLESPLTDKTASFVCKSMHLRSEKENITVLKELGVDAVTLANNHILDFGRKGLEDTIDALETAGIGWYGVNGKTLLLEMDEKICLSGFCCYSANGAGYTSAGRKEGINTLTLENVMSQVENDKKAGAVSVVSIHWGLEHTNYPAYEHIKLAEKIAQMNQTVIHGHHPHIVQGIQQKDNGSVIAYSLGNAVFDAVTSLNKKFRVEMNEQNRKALVLEVEIKDGRIAGYSYKGFYIGSNRIESLNIGREIELISKQIEEISDIAGYEKMRMEQYKKVIQSKFGKHDMKWLMSRMNYYSIGAYITGRLRYTKYKKEAEKFING